MTEENATPTRKELSKRARLEAMERHVEAQEALTDRLPVLVKAWGENDPVVRLVQAAVVDDASLALADAAAAAINGRLAGEVEHREGTELEAIVAVPRERHGEQGYDLVRRYSVDLHDGMDSLLPILQDREALYALRSAELLNLLVANESGWGVADSPDCTGAARQARLLVDVPDEKVRELGQRLALAVAPEVVGIGGFKVPDPIYRLAVNRLRHVNAGHPQGTVFTPYFRCEPLGGKTEGSVYIHHSHHASEREENAHRLPGGAVACKVLTFLAEELGRDVSEGFFVMEHDQVVGVGGWKGPAAIAAEAAESATLEEARECMRSAVATLREVHRDLEAMGQRLKKAAATAPVVAALAGETYTVEGWAADGLLSDADNVRERTDELASSIHDDWRAEILGYVLREQELTGKRGEVV